MKFLPVEEPELDLRNDGRLVLGGGVVSSVAVAAVALDLTDAVALAGVLTAGCLLSREEDAITNFPSSMRSLPPLFDETIIGRSR